MSFNRDIKNTTYGNNSEGVSPSNNSPFGYNPYDRGVSSLENRFERSVSIDDEDDEYQHYEQIHPYEEGMEEEEQDLDDEDLFGSDDDEDEDEEMDDEEEEDDGDDNNLGFLDDLIQQEQECEDQRRQDNILTLRDRYRYNHGQQNQDTSFGSSGNDIEHDVLPEVDWPQDLHNNEDGEFEYDSLNGRMDTGDEDGLQQWQQGQIEDQRFQQELFQQQFLQNQQWQQFHQQHFEPDPHQPVDYNQQQQQLVGRSYAGGNDLWQCSQNFHYRH